MGYPMAGHLAKAGHRVTVYNRNAGEGRALGRRTASGQSAPTPAAAAAGAEIVLMCVGNDDDVRAVVLGADGALAAMRTGAILVDHTTASAQIAREIHAAAHAQGHRLSRRAGLGRPGRRRERQAHDHGRRRRRDFARAEPVLAHYARAVTLMGGPGSGQLTKMVNQICIAGLVQALAEGIAFAEKAGLDVERGARRDQQGRGAVVADGEPRQDDGSPTSSTSASPSTGCARTSRSASPKRAPAARRCR